MVVCLVSTHHSSTAHTTTTTHKLVPGGRGCAKNLVRDSEG
jgi:hypothetical protein